VAQLENLKTLNKRAKNGVVAEALLVKYKMVNENPTGCELV